MELMYSILEVDCLHLYQFGKSCVSSIDCVSDIDDYLVGSSNVVDQILYRTKIMSLFLRSMKKLR